MVYLVRLNLMAGIKYALFGGPRVRMQLLCIVVAGIVALAAALVITHRAFDGFGAPTPSAPRGALLWQAFPQGRPPEYRVEEPKYRRMWPTITSDEEPWGLRTMADGDVYPDAVPRGSYLQHRQRGRIIVYTVEEVQDMLAGVGDFCWMPLYPKFTSPNPAIRGLPAWNTTDDDNNATSTKRAVNDSSSNNNTTSNQTNVAGDRCDLTHSGAGVKATPFTMHERRQRRLAAILNPPLRYTPVVIFADLGLVNAQSENLPAEWVMYELIRARVTDAVIVAVFVHRQRVEAALNLKLAQEYLRLPGVMRVMTTWLFDDPPAGCEGMLQLADVIQPHMLIATADELSFRTCTVKNVSQRCYGADRNWPNCTRPVALAEYTNYGVEGVAHVPSLVYPGTLMRPLRRADTPDGPRGTNRFHGWPLPFGRPWWEAARFAVCPQWEPKLVEPLPGAYVNENLRPLPCNDTKRCALSPLYNPPCPRPPWEPAPANHTCTHGVNAAANNNNNNNSSSADNNSTNRSGCSNDAGVAASLRHNDTVAAPPTSAGDYWEFPPRHTFPFRPPPVERPRRLAWSLVGSTHYGDRMTATIAFARAFIGLPSLVKSGGLERVDAFRSVLCDSVFVPMGGGVVAYEAIRAHEAMRCGTIPVISSSALSVKGVLGEPLPIGHPDSAYRTLIGFEGQWPDGWLVADTWAEAAAMARRVLDTPGEVVRLRRLVMGAHERMVGLMHERVRVAARRAADPAHFWDEHAAWAAYYLSVSPFHSR